MADNLDDIIMEAATRFEVPPSYINALIQQESGRKQFAESPRGAMGYMQVMPATYEGLRKQHGLGDDPFDTRNNILAGTAYLKEMATRFGSPQSAFAAYNMGPAGFERYQKGQQGMPAETSTYVSALTKKLGLGAEQDGAEVPVRPEPKQVPTEPVATVPPPGLLQPATPKPQQGLLADGPAEPALNKWEYITNGALKGLAPMMGAQPTRVSFGQVLAGLGNGMASGKAGYDAAVTARQDNLLKRALTQSEIVKNLRPDATKSNLTDDQKEFQLAQAEGYKGSFMDYMREIKEAGRPNTTVTVENAGLKKAAEKMAEMDVKRVETLRESAETLRGLLPDLATFEAANQEFSTGAFGNGLLGLQKMMGRLGVELPGTTEGEVMGAIQSRLAPAMRAPGSGASSDRDVQMFLSSLPALSNTPNGNRAIVAMFRTLAERREAEAEFAYNWMQENDSLKGMTPAMNKQFGDFLPKVSDAKSYETIRPGTLYLAEGKLRIKGGQ
jgi:hypothetical protein